MARYSSNFRNKLQMMVGIGKECGFTSNFDMPRSFTTRKTELRCKMVNSQSRTEIQGGPGGPWPPQKFSVVAAVNLCSFISISEYQIGTPFSYVYLVHFPPFTSLGSPLVVCTNNQTCPMPEPCIHPKIDLPVKSVCIEEQKLALF